MIWGIIIGIIIFIILLVFELVYLSSHFKQKRAKSVMEKGNYEHAYLGIGGTGFVAIKNKKLMIFKTPRKNIDFHLSHLYVFTDNYRTDFNTEFAPLTAIQSSWGVIFKQSEFNAFIGELKKRHVLVTAKSDLLTAANDLINEEHKS